MTNHKLTGFLRKQFTGDGLKVELTSKHAVRFSYYYKIKHETTTIKQLLDATMEIEKNKDILNSLPLTSNQKIFLRQSLLVNIVISYAKFFTSKSEDEAIVSHPKLKEENCYKNEGEEIFCFHNKIMETRHKCFSHGVQNEHEHTIPYMYLEPVIGTTELTGRLGVNSIGIINYSLEELTLFNKLLEKLKVYIEKN